MAIANDNYYGYIRFLLVSKQVTWLEKACASLCWSTVLGYYLEEPYGHLMLEDVSGAQSRAQVRGNLFSFTMPWEDIEEICSNVIEETNQSHSQDQKEVKKLWHRRGAGPT